MSCVVSFWVAIQASHGSTLELLYRSVIVPSSSSSESDATTSSCLEGSDDPVLSWAAFITDSLLNSALLHTALASLRSPDPECVATSEQLVCVRLAGHCLGVDEESGLVSPESSPLTPFSPRILIDIVHTYCALSARRSRTPTAHACAHCGGSESPQKVCSRCKATRYCSPACQAAHWPVHKALCVPPPPTPALSPAATVFLRLLWESKACLLTILSCGAVVITGDSSLLNLELESELAGPFIRLLHADATACEKPALQAVMPFGFKAACMRLLANASAHASTVLKDAVLASGALTLVLNSCKVDPQQPMQREWALLAIRHLCDGHAPTQAFIAQLKAIAVVDSPELAALGVKATVNEDGKVDIQKPDGGAGTK